MIVRAMPMISKLKTHSFQCFFICIEITGQSYLDISNQKSKTGCTIVQKSPIQSKFKRLGEFGCKFFRRDRVVFIKALRKVFRVFKPHLVANLRDAAFAQL